MRQNKEEQEAAALIPISKQNKKQSCCKSYCRWTNKSLVYSVIAFLSTLLLFAIGQHFIVPDRIDDFAKETVRNNVIIKEEHMDGSHDPYNSWVNNTCIDCAGGGYFSYYIYNMTNPEQVLYESALPEFEELGPWVYRRFGHKKNVKFYDIETNGTNGTKSRVVSYTSVPNYVYQPELSTELDRFTSRIFTINFALLGFFNTLNFGQTVGVISPQWDELMQTAPVESILYNSTAFKYLHGINNEMVESVSPIGNSTFFRLLAMDENGVIEKTGEYDDNNCRELLIYDNFTRSETGHPLISIFIPYTWDRTDDFVAGSRETLQFPPFDFVGKNKNGNGVLKIWGTEKYRPVDYIFQKEVTYKGLKMNRYRISDEVWLNTTDRPENDGYHLDNLPSGIINATLIRGSPSMLSKGHFLGAPYYEKNVNEKFNIKMILDDSDEEEDDQIFDMDPFSGVGFRQYHTYQINFHAIELDRPYNTSYMDADLSFWGDVIPFARIVVRGGAPDETIEDVANRYKQRDVYFDLSFYGAIIIPIVCVLLMAWIIYKMRKELARESSNNKLSAGNQADISLAVAAAPNASDYGTTKPM